MESPADPKHHLQSTGNTLQIPTKSTVSIRQRTSATTPSPPDGGWGWVVCFTSMMCNGIVFGIVNCFGIIYVSMLDNYAKGDPNISFKTSWVGSVTTGTTFFMCMLSSIISDQAGIRPTGLIGGALAFIGLLSSAFVEELMLLYLTYGILLGVGFAFSYAPSLVILGHYFRKRLGLVNGLVTFGSSAVTMGLALGLPHLLKELGLRNTLFCLTGLVFLLIPCALTWKPIFTKENIGVSQAALSTMSIEMIQSRCNDCLSFTKKYLNIRIWRNKGYVVWALSCGFCLFGYFVPFVHLVKFVNDKFPDEDGTILVLCIAITSGASRIVCGKLADLECVNRIRFQQSAFLLLGTLTLCIPFSESFWGLIVITLLIGVCDGVFICLLGPIAFDIVGERGASQALGFLFGIFALPMSVGPPVAGLLYDHLGSYNIAFHLAGCPPIIGALLMFFIPKTKRTFPAVTSLQEFGAVSCHDIYRSHVNFEEEITSPPVSSVNPEIITIDNVGALLTEPKSQNGQLANDILEVEIQEESTKKEDIKEAQEDKNNSNHVEEAKESDPMI